MCGWLSKKKDDVTPLRIENAQSASSSSLITAPFGGVLNERRCKAKEVNSSDMLATNDTVKAVPKPRSVGKTTTR